MIRKDLVISGKQRLQRKRRKQMLGLQSKTRFLSLSAKQNKSLKQ
jgi:hypothetical protein